ncbi:hypothetical protein J437_LFUL005730 [Ladona fulva]|uniref:Major facilitator superfamily (MFS) profile domain-containing protein n=1 Tax=Ladona fulva TaxID=123851 RepID=A0A8K0NXL8_LADFU|nr:hypothetical protein J437_LFUL005730 [Ladona fulva]
MVKERNRTDAIVQAFGNYSSGDESVSNDDELCLRNPPLESKDAGATNWNLNSTDFTDEGDKFDWDSVEQGMILGAFYWTYVMSLVPGAMLARRFGTKVLYGGANAIAAIFTLLTPFAARKGFIFLIIVRLIEGFASGTTFPAMHTMASRWIPPEERSKFVSTYVGNSAGTAFTYPLCGFLIHSFGWPSAFYVPGCISLGWGLFWWLLASDSPSTHPRITKEEREYIEKAVSPSLNNTKLPIPWLEIATSLPVWAVCFGNFSVLWAFMIVVQYAPTYLKTVHGFNIRAVTVLLPGLLYTLMTNVGCDTAAEIAILTLAAGFGGAGTSGPLANTMDLSPNYCGIILSLINLICMSNGFMVPSIVGAILNNNYSKERWRIVFMITTGISVVCSLFYVLFASGEVQPWNRGPKRKVKKIDDTKYSPASVEEL